MFFFLGEDGGPKPKDMRSPTRTGSPEKSSAGNDEKLASTSSPSTSSLSFLPFVVVVCSDVSFLLGCNFLLSTKFVRKRIRVRLWRINVSWWKGLDVVLESSWDDELALSPLLRNLSSLCWIPNDLAYPGIRYLISIECPFFRVITIYRTLSVTVFW
jgi:hypothetical protein